MKSLLEQVRENHVVTEGEGGNYCWTCTLASGEAEGVLYPCPTLLRAEELDAMTPLLDPEA